MQAALAKLQRRCLPTKGEWSSAAVQIKEAHRNGSINVCIVDRDIAGAEALAKELNDSGKTKAIAIECNVTDWDSQVAAFDKAVTEFGRIDYVLPIAGVGERRWLKKDQKETWTKPDLACIDVNLTGPLYTIALAVQQFRRQEKNEHGFRGKRKLGARACRPRD